MKMMEIKTLSIKGAMLIKKILESEAQKKMKECRDCPDRETHETGSLLWVSCRYVVGWRSIDSKCTLKKEGA